MTTQSTSSQAITGGRQELLLRTCALELRAPLIMGVVNVTPDSFSDGGRFVSLDNAIRQAEAMLEQGATIIDVGGESTRPGAELVDARIELARVLPLIEYLARRGDCVVSIDTMKPEVMRAACDAGAEWVNDVNALRAPGAVEAVRDSGAAVCLMHMLGDPRTMQRDPQYTDVVGEVSAFLQARADVCRQAGIDARRIVIDPGFGFGKRVDHNVELLRRLKVLVNLGYPVLVGLSRKSMLGTLTDRSVDERVVASAVAAAMAIERGASIVRVHDVAATMDAVRMVAAVRMDDAGGSWEECLS